MPFIWNSNPNLPVVMPAPVIGPTEVTTEVHVVANTVNVSGLVVGTLSYNTANKGYDVIYEIPSLNVRTLRAQTLMASQATINIATINTATINTATINTANIVNATITNGLLGGDPNSNLQIATKHYVVALVANSIPLGGNLQLLIQAAGDLLVGISDNTAERLPVSTTDGAALSTGGTGNTGLRWTTRSPGATQSHRGMYIGTNFDEYLRNNQIHLIHTDEIVLDTGTRVASGWDGLTANIGTSGVGGLDTGTVVANTCYEVWAIRDSNIGSQGLILHRALDRLVDATINTIFGAATTRKVKFAYGTGLLTSGNVAQSFLATKSGPFTGIDLSLARVGSPVGNCWITLEANTVLGNASGIPLATSRLMNVARFPTDTSPPARIRFVFDTRANVVSGNSYWAVVQVDYPQANVGVNENHIMMFGTSSGTGAYANGVAKNFSSNTNSWEIASSATALGPVGPEDLYFRTFVEANDTALVMPTGYDEKCLISYAFTDFTTHLREYKQRGHKMSMSYNQPWAFVYNGGTGVPTPGSGSDNPSSTLIDNRLQVLNLSGYVPPVPCLLTIYHYGLSFNTVGSFGSLASTDMTPVVGGFPSVTESVGAITANLSSTGDGIYNTGPILIEQQCFLIRFNSALGQMYVAALEF